MSIDIDPTLRKAIFVIFVPIVIGFCLFCWYSIYLLIRFLYDFTVSLLS